MKFGYQKRVFSVENYELHPFIESVSADAILYYPMHLLCDMEYRLSELLQKYMLVINAQCSG